jgi:hypothetical protein
MYDKNVQDLHKSIFKILGKDKNLDLIKWCSLGGKTLY